MNVLLLGASGLVGRECLALLLGDQRIGQIHVLLRRPLGLQDLLGQAVAPHVAERVRLHVLDFEQLADDAALAFDSFAVDAVICALGTTIKQAGSQAAFRRVDHDYPLMAARRAMAQGASHYLLVSAMGASAGSAVFYNRVKGEVEEDIAALGFESFTVARPSLLLGQRPTFRLGESLVARMAWLIPPPWTPVHVRQVARGLHDALHHPAAGHRILGNMSLRRHSAAAIPIPTV